MLACLSTIYRVVFVHGLRDHPRGTWEVASVASSKRRDTTKKHKHQFVVPATKGCVSVNKHEISICFFIIALVVYVFCFGTLNLT